MYDVYVKETHPDMHPDGQPETFEERIEMYEYYKEEHNITIPVLIDDMQNTWKKLYLPGPTGCILIDIRGIVVYTIQFIMSGNSYSTIDNEIGKLLKATEDYTSIPYENNAPDISSYSITQLNKGTFSIGLPAEESYSVEIFNLQGARLLSRSSCGTGIFNLNDFFSAGKYFIRINTKDQAIVKPLIIGQ